MRRTVECDHKCEIHQPGKVTTEILGAIDTSPKAKARARRRMDPKTRETWDKISESVAEFKRQAAVRAFEGGAAPNVEEQGSSIDKEEKL